MNSFNKLTAVNLEKILSMLDDAQRTYCPHKGMHSDAYLAYEVAFSKAGKKYFEPKDEKNLSVATLCENIAHILFREQKPFLAKYCPGSLYEFELPMGNLHLVDIELSGCSACRGPAFGILYPDKLEHFSIPSDIKYVLNQFAKDLSVPLGKRTKRCVI